MDEVEIGAAVKLLAPHDGQSLAVGEVSTADVYGHGIGFNYGIDWPDRGMSWHLRDEFELAEEG